MIKRLVTFLVASILLSLTCYGADSTRWVADYGQLVNNGLAAYENRDTGLARLNWERALLMDLDGSAAKQNILVLRRNMPDEVIPVPDFVLSKWWRAFHATLHPDTWSILQVIAFLALAFLLYQRWRGPGAAIRWIAVLGVVTVILYCSGCAEYDRRQGDTTAVVMQRCAMYAGPDDRSDHVLDLSPGQKLHILNRLDGWIEVARMDRVAGWTRSSCIEEI